MYSGVFVVVALFWFVFFFLSLFCFVLFRFVESQYFRYSVWAVPQTA